MTQPPVSRVRAVRPDGGPAAWAVRLSERHPFVREETERGRTVTFRLSSGCTQPVMLRAYQGEAESWLATEVLVRCRKCAACLQARRREWVARALREFAALGDRRTWFVTLTVSPDWRYRHSAMAAARHGPPFHDYPLEKKRLLALMELSKTVTVWLKRFRITSERLAVAEGRERPRIRYLMAFEEHPTSGEWHVHLLVHEVSGQVRERTFRETWWPVGFAQAKLVKKAAGAALYVSWYLEGHPGTRMRASLRYGAGGESAATGGLSPPQPQSPPPRPEPPFNAPVC